MKKKILLFSFIACLSGKTFSQFVQPNDLPDLPCHVDVNAMSEQDYRNDLKRSVIKLELQFGSCSGTLINRNTTQGDLGQYFITAWHCFKSGTNCGGSEADFTRTVGIVFNYQSPNDQPNVFINNGDGGLYRITRQIRLVTRVACAEGDFALCEILGDPIPPYFNPYYAGWYPNELLMSLNGDFAAIHHPGGTIKKISKANYLVNSGNIGGVKSTCVTVTKIIDFLLGWIWKRKWSTQVICTYLQLPFVGPKWEVPGVAFDYGKIEEGSSGGGLFTGESGFAGANRFIGQLSASAPEHHCGVWTDVGISYFGKFSDTYYRQAVKNTLNPSNDYWVDQSGIPGRQISCYPTINIAAAGSSTLNLFPANTYQQENAIRLQAQTNFVTTGRVIVRNGADYTFLAGENIDLNQGFEVEAGARFHAEATTAPCVMDGWGTRKAGDNTGFYETPDLQKLLETAPLPSEKKFDINKYLPAVEVKKAENVNTFNLFPNPSKGTINIELFLKEKENNARVEIYDLYGRRVYTRKYSNIYFIKETLNLPGLQNGMYNVIIKTDKETFSKRVIIAH